MTILNGSFKAFMKFVFIKVEFNVVNGIDTLFSEKVKKNFRLSLPFVVLLSVT